ncbi:hypothetical protein B0H14DRAFT_3132373 [Mycena olivaceomarginata]|nr:hypothetical protein B0H14DRAFT_3132373 [Mycena olivaceomarginata]
MSIGSSYISGIRSPMDYIACGVFKCIIRFARLKIMRRFFDFWTRTSDAKSSSRLWSEREVTAVDQLWQEKGRAQAFVFTGNTRAVWQSSLIKFLGRHPSVLSSRSASLLFPSLPWYTMIQGPPLLTYTRLTIIETPITIFHMLDPYCFVHLVDVRLLDLDGLFDDQSPALANCLNRLADNAPDLRALDVIFTKPATSYPAGTDSSEQLRRPPQSFNHIYMCAGGPADDCRCQRPTLCSFPQLKVLILGAKPAKEKNQRAWNTQIMPEVVPRAQRAEDERCFVEYQHRGTHQSLPQCEDGLTSYKIIQLCPGSFLE